MERVGCHDLLGQAGLRDPGQVPHRQQLVVAGRHQQAPGIPLPVQEPDIRDPASMQPRAQQGLPSLLQLTLLKWTLNIKSNISCKCILLYE